MCPKNASYYGNRAATLMMLYRYREALEDSQQAVRLDSTFLKVSYILLKSKCKHSQNMIKVYYGFLEVWPWCLQSDCNMGETEGSYQLCFVTSFLHTQGHLREGKCHLLLGNAMAANRCFQKVLELEPENNHVQQEVSLPHSWGAWSDRLTHYEIYFETAQVRFNTTRVSSYWSVVMNKAESEFRVRATVCSCQICREEKH